MRSAKFGARLRKLADTSDNNKKTKYECPRCGKMKVARKGYAIWKCKSCDSVYAGGAYSLKTEKGEIALRLTRSYEIA
jgi:large subunit ribosomal protein L37Ae